MIWFGNDLEMSSYFNNDLLFSRIHKTNTSKKPTSNLTSEQQKRHLFVNTWMIASKMVRFRHFIFSWEGKSTTTDGTKILLTFAFINFISNTFDIFFILILYSLPTVIVLKIFPIGLFIFRDILILIFRLLK